MEEGRIMACAPHKRDKAVNEYIVKCVEHKNGCVCDLHRFVCVSA